MGGDIILETEKYIVYRSRRFYLFMALWFTVSGIGTGAMAAYCGTLNLQENKLIAIFVIWLGLTLFFYCKAYTKQPLLVADHNGLAGNISDLEPVQWWRISELLLFEAAGQKFMAIVTRDGEDVLEVQGIPRSLVDYPLIPAETFSALVNDSVDAPAPYFIPLSILPIGPEQLIDELSKFSRISYRYI